jgi:predicted transcriptional regulator
MISHAIEMRNRRYGQRQRALAVLKLAGKTQGDIAKLAGVSNALVSNFFKAENNNKRVEQAVKDMLEVISVTGSISNVTTG